MSDRRPVHFATGFPVLVMPPSPTRPYPSGIILLCLYSRSMPTNADAQRCYRQRRALATGPDADVRRRRVADAAIHCERQNDTVHNSSPPLVHTRSTHSQQPTPHRTCEGVQQPNLTVSTKHVIKLITLTFFSLRAHRTRTLASRRQPT